MRARGIEGMRLLHTFCAAYFELVCGFKAGVALRRGAREKVGSEGKTYG